MRLYEGCRTGNGEGLNMSIIQLLMTQRGSIAVIATPDATGTRHTKQSSTNVASVVARKMTRIWTKTKKIKTNPTWLHMTLVTGQILCKEG